MNSHNPRILPLEEVIRKARSLGNNPLVLTPNRRLSSRLSLTFDLMHLRGDFSDSVAWARWRFMPWESWLSLLWEDVQLKQWLTIGRVIHHQEDSEQGQSNHSERPMLLLSTLQERLIWQQVIAKSEWGHRLLNCTAMAKMTQEAAKRLVHYEIDELMLANFVEPDTTQLLAWQEECEAVCLDNGWASPSTLIRRLKDSDVSRSLAQYDALLLYGFRFFSPQESGFLLSLKKKYGCQVASISLSESLDVSDDIPNFVCHEPTRVLAPNSASSTSTQVVVYSAAEKEEEYQRAIAWAWEHLEVSSQKGVDDLPRIGIVIPDLDQDREWIVRLYTRHCYPKGQFDPVHQNDVMVGSEIDRRRFFNVSGGTPVWQTPIFHIMDCLFALLTGSCSLPQFGQLLRSPFMGGAESESFARHMAERKISERQVTRLNLTKLFGWQSLLIGCDDLYERIVCAKEWLAGQQPARKKYSLETWLSLFKEWLDLWGWPGQRTLSSSEFQMHSKWFELQTEFVQLQMIHLEHGKITDKNPHQRSEMNPSTTYSLLQALSLLRQAGETMTYQPQSEEAPIQILGLLEADGQTFDYLWVCGLHSEAWPQSVKPNPLLPASLQRIKNMPHASPERELLLAKQMLQGFKAASRKMLVLSFPQQEGDRELLPSPLLKPYQALAESLNKSWDDTPDQAIRETGSERNSEGVALPIFNDTWLEWAGQQVLEMIPEQKGAALPVGQAVRGGTSIIKDQGACPFRAYVRYRLGAQPLEQQRIGFSPAERGEAIHVTLELFWKHLQSQEQLLALESGAVHRLIVSSAQAAMGLLLGERQHHYSELFLQLEVDRLVRLSQTWIDHERERQPFLVVATEQEQIETIDDFELRMRVDRIDRLEDGSLLIIDYKTGYAKVTQWMDESLSEPQLPLYCIVIGENVEQACASGAPISGIAFGEVKAEKNRLSALVRSGVSLYNKKVRHVQALEEWDDLFAQWQVIILDRIRSFKSGWAVVDPRDGKNTCLYCPYQSVCRIGER